MAKNINVQNISLDLIDPNPQNKEIFVVSDVDGLLNSIKEHGFMGAIEVYKKPDGRYQISAGHRRYNVMKLLKEKTIPCIVEEMEDDCTVTKKLIESNINIRTLSPMELSRSINAYEKALNEEGYPGSVNSKLMEVFNISETKLLKLKSISKLAESLQKFAYKPNFPYEAFYDATYFSQERQKQLYELLVNHFNRFPEAELSKNLVTQYIQQVKNEIKLEKEKSERDKILKTINVSPKSIKTPDEYVESLKQTPINNNPSPQFISYEAPYATKTSEITILNEYEQPVISLDEKQKDNEESIDFEMELHVSRMKKLMESNNISISKEAKKKLVKNMELIIEQIKMIEEK